MESKLALSKSFKVKYVIYTSPMHILNDHPMFRNAM